jgi:hypothetical protein
MVMLLVGRRNHDRAHSGPARARSAIRGGSGTDSPTPISRNASVVTVRRGSANDSARMTLIISTETRQCNLVPVAPAKTELS